MTPVLAWRLFALECKRVFAYRAEFWIGFLGTALSQFAVAFLLWAAIFADTGRHTLGGFTLRDLALYYLLIPLVERVVMGAEMRHISDEIYNGTLTRFLLYPIGFFRFKYVASLAQTAVYAGQMAVVAALFLLALGAPPAFHFSALGCALAVAAALCGSALYFALAACLEMVAFWADNVWSLMILNRMVLNFLGGGLLPLAFFPAVTRKLLTYTPFPYLVSFPLRCLMQTPSARDATVGFGVMTCWTLALTALARWIWRRGAREFAGVGI